MYLIRGPPACGKTTLAQSICSSYPYHGKDGDAIPAQSFVYISGKGLQDTRNGDTDPRLSLVDFIERKAKGEFRTHGTTTFVKCNDMIEWLKKRSVGLIIDEAHLVLRQNIFTSLFKDSQVTVIYFTTSDEQNVEGKLTHTLSGLAKTFYWSGGINTEKVVEALEQTTVRLTPAAVRALIQISGVHRGIFVVLCHWVQKKQQPPTRAQA